MSMYTYCHTCGATSHDFALVCPECGAAMVLTGGFVPLADEINWGDVAVTVGVFALLSTCALAGIWLVMHVIQTFGAHAVWALFI